MAALLVTSGSAAVAGAGVKGPPAAPVTHTVTGVLGAMSCASRSVCFALNDAKKGQRWGITRLKRHGASAHTTLVSKAFTLYGLSCPSNAGCEALGTRVATNSPVLIPVSKSGVPGKARSTGAPTGTFIAAIGCHPTRSHCTLVGAFGGVINVVTVNGSKSTTRHRKVHTSASIVVNAISCPTSSLCEVVGLMQGNTNKGFIVSIHHGVPGKPILVPKATGSGLVAIACPSARTCYSAGDTELNADFIDTLTNGNVTHSAALKPGTGIKGIACTAPHACDAVGGYFAPEATVEQGDLVPLHGGTPGAPQLTSVTPVYHSVGGFKGGIEVAGLDASPHKLFDTIVSAS